MSIGRGIVNKEEDYICDECGQKFRLAMSLASHQCDPLMNMKVKPRKKDMKVKR